MVQKSKKGRSYRSVAAVMAVLCFVASAAMAAISVAPAIDPRLAAAEVSCTFWYCAMDTDPMRLVTEAAGAIPLQVNEPLLEGALLAPLGRLLFAAAGLAASLPWAFMFLFLGLGFRAAGKRAELDAAARSLRQAALAAVIGACLVPVAATLQATGMTPALDGGQQLFVRLDFGGVFWGFLIAGTAYVATWVIEQALAAQRQLASIV